ncbi:MAG TPA: HEAT repeat domain-containing protein [Vicinamibacterales bacterium]|jgi:HEAT repeat protein
MPIQRSAGDEIRSLLEALAGSNDTRRESAVARLAVIGPRAVEHLLQGFAAAAPQTRAGILRALEAIGDPRALRTAAAGLQDPSTAVQAAAIGALRALVAGDRASTAREAFDELVGVALNRERGVDVRIAAWEAIRDSAQDADAAVRAALATDPNPALRAAVDGPAAPAPLDVWSDAIDGRLPPLADALRLAFAEHRGTAGLTQLQRLVDLVRAREREETDAESREQWRAVRGALHLALAGRGSRLALYDLRDSLFTPERLPVAFLAALEDVGDATCLDALAAAYESSSPSGDAWWREHLGSAFRAIVGREGLTRRHAVIKRVLARWPEAGELLR